MPKKTAAMVCKCLRRWFIRFGVAEEVVSDGGPPFDSNEYKEFLRLWGAKRRLSSAYYPQSNGRAELAVKAAKRILTSNVGPDGTLDTDGAGRALLLHRNTPVHDVGQSPAILLFGRPLRDHLPSASLRMRAEWSSIADAREGH
jgi:transposase InsO family protein